MVHCKCYRITLPERNDLWTGLHARPLLCEHEFATGEVSSGLGKKKRDLDREYVLAIEVLMEAVIVAGLVLEKQRRGTLLAGLMAPSDEGIVSIGIAGLNSHRLVPVVRQRVELRIQFGSQLLDQAGQGIREVFVFAAAEPVPAHDDSAAEAAVVRIPLRDQRAFLWRENFFQYSAPLRVQLLFQSGPVELPQTLDWRIPLVAGVQRFRLYNLLFRRDHARLSL